MKHLITTFSGGFPFDLDDYRYMESGFNEDITSILNAYTYTEQHSSLGVPLPHSFIIYGCELYMTTYTPPGGGPSTAGFGWTAGAVFISGTIYRVNARTTPSFVGMEGPGSAHYFEPTLAYDPAGFENFKNGTAHDTYGIRVAVPTLQSVTSGKLAFNEKTPRFLSNIKHVNHDYLSVDAYGSSSIPAFGQGFMDGDVTFGMRKNEIGQVEFKGRIQHYATPGFIPIICTLPPDMTPSEMGYHTVVNSTTFEPFVVLVGTLGAINCIVAANIGIASIGDYLDFSGLRFSTV